MNKSTAGQDSVFPGEAGRTADPPGFALTARRGSLSYIHDGGESGLDRLGGAFGHNYRCRVIRRPRR